MNKKSNLLIMISAGILLLANSASAMEYKLLDDQTTIVLPPLNEPIGESLITWASSFNRKNTDTKMFISIQEANIISEKITTLQALRKHSSSQPASIQLIFQIIIALIAIVIFIIFSIGTTLSVVAGFVISLCVITLVSIAIFLMKLIRPNC